jgi:hypothetical protein
MPGYFSRMDSSIQPSLVNYGRVLLDVVMVGLLVLVVAADVRLNSTDPAMSIHVHEVPIYLKQGVDFRTMWAKAHDSTDLDDAAKLQSFQTPAAMECATITTHPMCVCIRDSMYMLDAKNCLLQHPIPSRNMDWNVASVSAALVLWFLASLATSIGTLPFINSYVTHEGGAEGTEKHTVVAWHRFVVASYGLITIAALTAPMLVIAIQFPGSKPHMDSLFNMLMWSVLAVISIATYNYATITGYLSWTKVKNGENEVEATQTTMSVHNFILYVHLLVSAPAIAMIIHINQSWTEHHTILNTTLVLSTIFAVDGFSAEMANYWTSKAKDADIKLREKQATAGVKMGQIGPYTSSPSTKEEEEAAKKIDEMHTRLGLVRLFAWTVNAVMLLLLFSLAYPLEIEHQRTNSALFVVVVIMFAAVFLAPDLVREFTQRISFNNIQFRLYGDFVLRCLVLFFTWRSSITERT